MLQAKTISLVCQGKLMQVNQLFSQIVLTTTCSLQCPAKEIILTISLLPLSFQQHTSYISHIRQPIKCDCLFLFDCRFRSHSLPQARWTAKRKRQWKRSFKYFQLFNNFVRLSLDDLRRTSTTPSARISFVERYSNASTEHLFTDNSLGVETVRNYKHWIWKYSPLLDMKQWTTGKFMSQVRKTNELAPRTTGEEARK